VNTNLIHCIAKDHYKVLGSKFYLCTVFRSTMADVHNKATRSYNMSRIRGKDTKPEMIVRKFLFARGFRYRLHSKKLLGKPDIVLPMYKTVILIHGCFWHGHEECKYSVVPKTRTEWWIEKIGKNKANDERVISFLRDTGWQVIIIWGCDLKSGKENAVLSKLAAQIKQQI
jgi:DNA mismatch endonuclease (patch repair protein)